MNAGTGAKYTSKKSPASNTLRLKAPTDIKHWIGDCDAQIAIQFCDGAGPDEDLLHVADRLSGLIAESVKELNYDVMESRGGADSDVMASASYVLTTLAFLTSLQRALHCEIRARRARAEHDEIAAEQPCGAT
jgi:hypothetical protein